jgi:hypothetical protein
MWGEVPGRPSAAPPDHGIFTSHDVFVDSDVCAPEGFSVDVVEDEVDSFRVFFDRSGKWHGSPRTSTTAQ